MKIKVTHKVIERMILRSKKNFLKSSFFGSDIKKKVFNLKVHIYFNKRIKVTYGCANALELEEAEKFVKIDRRHKGYLIDSKRKYLIMEINEESGQNHPSSELFDTVSHELAHLIDFCIRGFQYNLGETRTPGNYHDPFWKAIHLAMGGSGEATLTY